MKEWQRVIRTLIRIFVSVGFFGVKLIPLDTVVFMGSWLGLIVFYLFKGDRVRCIENLKKSFPEKSKAEILKIAREVFSNQGRNIAELLCFPRLNKKRINRYVKIEGEENLKEALRKGVGVIILAAHFGNWELLGAALGTNGYPLHVIARKIYDPVLNKKLVKLRLVRNIHIIQRGESPKEILRVFRNNRMLGIILDQNSKRFPGILVDFFGRKCYTSIGLASIVSKKDIPVLPCFIVRGRAGHTLHVEKPVILSRLEDKKEEIRENTQIFTEIIERWVKKYPSQWVWMHDRWKIPNT